MPMIFIVKRPYCAPGRVVVIAYSKKQALKLACEKYGPVSDAEAKAVTKIGVIEI